MNGNWHQVRGQMNSVISVERQRAALQRQQARAARKQWLQAKVHAFAQTVTLFTAKFSHGHG